MKNYTFVLSVFFFLVSCSTNKNKNTEIINTQIEDENNVGVYFKWPKDLSTVSSPVFIDMGLDGMLIEPAGKVREGYGHHHILINQKSWPLGDVIPMSDSTLHYGKGQKDASIELLPGRYVISLQFADGVHASYGKEMASSITINVE
mgnify:FL=1|jgi:hypothetical protein|tara:strand:+ start:81418 stop:81858 length:441 start_codon:yes stop_codon:yes gene_type:complete